MLGVTGFVAKSSLRLAARGADAAAGGTLRVLEMFLDRVLGEEDGGPLPRARYVELPVLDFADREQLAK